VQGRVFKRDVFALGKCDLDSCKANAAFVCRCIRTRSFCTEHEESHRKKCSEGSKPPIIVKATINTSKKPVLACEKENKPSKREIRYVNLVRCADGSCKKMATRVCSCVAAYCGRKHQKKHWKHHRETCAAKGYQLKKREKNLCHSPHRPPPSDELTTSLSLAFIRIRLPHS